MEKAKHDVYTTLVLHAKGLLQHELTFGDMERFHVNKIKEKPHKDGKKRRPLTCWGCREKHQIHECPIKQQKKKISCKLHILITPNNGETDEGASP